MQRQRVLLCGGGPRSRFYQKKSFPSLAARMVCLARCVVCLPSVAVRGFVQPHAPSLAMVMVRNERRKQQQQQQHGDGCT